MGWDIDSSRRSNRLFHRLRLRLLLTYLTVMAASLAGFGAGVYGFVVSSLYQQLDKRLLTLAQAATPTHTDLQAYGGEFLDSVAEVPWRDIFNRDRQSLEWFDLNSRLLASKGTITIARPPKLGAQTLYSGDRGYPIRAYSISVFSDSPYSSVPILEGYVRASQSMEDVFVAKKQLLWGLSLGGSLALGCIGISSLWLTDRALIPVKQSFNQLRQFTADASHELRTPLTVIQGFVELMQEHPERVHPADIKKLQVLSSATEQMTCLTEDLLLLARADAGSEIATSDRHSILLDKLLEDLVSNYGDLARQQGIHLQFDRIEGHQTTIVGNSMHLRRLFGNLIENALQYTSGGGTIRVEVEPAARWVVTRIIDTGIGIPPEQLKFIFQRFWRAEAARTYRHTGSGLGLAIAQTIAQQHGGSIKATSVIKQGSCFTVALPADVNSYSDGWVAELS